MKAIQYRDVVDKSDWGPGPWNNEPDKAQWQDKATGLPCLIVRGPLGALCGYVGVPPGHPAYGKGDVDADVHGGLTFSNGCSPGPENRSVCHIPDSGESDSVWWLGFDCGHAFDLIPGIMAVLARVKSRTGPYFGEEYRCFAYVKREVRNLAAQLGELM